MRSLSIRVRLAVVLLTVIFANVAVQAVSFSRQDAELAALERRIADVVAAEEFANDIDSALQAQHNAVRDYVAVGDPEAFRRYVIARASEAGALTAIAASPLGSEIAGEIHAIRAAADGWRPSYLDAVIADVQTGRLYSARDPARFLAGTESV